MAKDGIRKAFSGTVGAALLVLTMLFVFLYLAVRTIMFFEADYHWYEKIMAAFLLLAEVFIMLHSFGYFLNILHVIRHGGGGPQPAQEPLPQLKTYPPVAILVASYHEPLHVLEDTLTCFYNLTYLNKQLYFLDDTRYDLETADQDALAAYRREIDELCQSIGVNLFRRRWRGAKAGIINDFLDFIAGRDQGGFEFTPYAGQSRLETAKYVIVFDADMNPFPDFVEPLVERMEANPRLAFIQTPQYYSNFDNNRVARAAGLQQAVFYEYICEGKNISDAMFCCGTNVIFRREAFEDVGGFDESSVTEDIATSLRFHLKGWSSAYLNKVCAFGMGPEDLGAYFRQQFRWALGTIGLGRHMLGQFLRRPGALPLGKWWEYFLSGTHYFVGWAFFIMMSCPILYLIWGVPAYFAKPELYFLVFFPYIALSVSIFLLTLERRHYAARDMFMGQLLIGLSFPVMMKASLLGILGVRGSFGITPKGRSLSLPLWGLWPQVFMCLLCVFAIAWGANRWLYEPVPAFAVAMNCFWCLYHLVIVSTSVMYFNRPVTE
ncbi:cellulose synthase [Desulfocarbo indianensis]|nr:cellulose synthase [Desulfocarbo indianensis]